MLRKNDIKVILDLHNYCRRNVDGKYLIIGEQELSIESLMYLWNMLATEFKNYNNIYGYGLMNEPHDMTPLTPGLK